MMWCIQNFFFEISYVSLIYKCSIVLKIFTAPFLSCTLPQRGEISNISNRQTKSAWKYIITLSILLNQPYAPQETNIYKAGMLLCTRRVCILWEKSCIILPQKQPKVAIFDKTDFLDLKYPPEVQVEPKTCSTIFRTPVPAILNHKNLTWSAGLAREGQNMAQLGH